MWTVSIKDPFKISKEQTLIKTAQFVPNISTTTAAGKCKACIHTAEDSSQRELFFMPPQLGMPAGIVFYAPPSTRDVSGYFFLCPSAGDVSGIVFYAPQLGMLAGLFFMLLS